MPNIRVIRRAQVGEARGNSMNIPPCVNQLGLSSRIVVIDADGTDASRAQDRSKVSAPLVNSAPLPDGGSNRSRRLRVGKMSLEYGAGPDYSDASVGGG